MSKLIIDGKEIDVPAEYTLLQACEAAGAEIPRAMPFADCTIEIAMPRRRTKCRDSSGTNATKPRQFAPNVMTIP